MSHCQGGRHLQGRQGSFSGYKATFERKGRKPHGEQVLGTPKQKHLSAENTCHYHVCFIVFSIEYVIHRGPTKVEHNGSHFTDRTVSL